MTVAIKSSINTDAITEQFFLPAAKFGLKPHQFNRDEFVAILKQFEGVGRGKHYEKYQTGTEYVLSLAEQLARRVSGRHNKNVIFILFGDLGSGKSMALLTLALYCAMWLKHLRGGTISRYFSFDHVAVIDPEMLKDKLENLVQYGVYVLDDAGPAYDARTFMSQSNRDLNYILQTARTTNNILLVSAPHGAMLDVTIHRVAQYYAEVAESHHDQGVSFLKVMRITRAYREKKIYYSYMGKKNVKFIRYYVGLPPPRLKEKYDIVRDEQARVIQARRQEREQSAQQNAAKPDMRRGGSIPIDAAVLEKLDKMLTKKKGYASLSEISTVAQCGLTRALKFVESAGWEVEDPGTGRAKSKYRKKTVVEP